MDMDIIFMLKNGIKTLQWMSVQVLGGVGNWIFVHLHIG